MLLQSIKMAWSSIAGNKMRSFLTMLGIIIGVVALVVLVSLVTSATTSVTDTISSLGSNMLTVNVSDDKGNPIRLSDLSDFTESEEISQAAPLSTLNVTAKKDYDSDSATLYGTTRAYMDIQGLELGSGRFLKTSDVENNLYVAVISYDMADTFFGTSNVVGESITLDGISFLVVGVLAEADEDSASLTSMMGGTDLTAYVPYTAAIRMSASLSNTVTTFYVSSDNEETLDLAEAELEAMLLDRFQEDEDAFTITNMSTIMDAMSSVTDVLALLLGGIAAISLLVGGIGIMNIMLVSVTERTREIGIRKAIGAGRGSIMLQFLVEALVVCLIGCAIGIILSWGILQIAGVVAGDAMSFTLSPTVVVVAVVFSVAIGLLFGLYPANKAAKKHPIEALRYDG